MSYYVYIPLCIVTYILPSKNADDDVMLTMMKTAAVTGV